METVAVVSHTETTQGLAVAVCQHGKLILHSLLAFAAASAIVVLLSCLSSVVSTSSCCPPGRGYSGCEMHQDACSVMGFAVGAVACALAASDSQSAWENSRKLKLFFLL
eukprot:CAMPEP_0179279438 /NCGR_PEP_ID=MMETSP0797-20121207/36114_1 /TAXON_ID=47934 /ORGANISM="Dinophysis acuminata, Strain DAEP01" /LENGTH=108 /DNA_ID=CAMNT_0020988067 /DNA_START=77 /DNA_END=403 /DNA_ORIENTATION=+